jgi:hypothetical protein
VNVPYSQEEIAKFLMLNDPDSYLMIGNSTLVDNYFVPVIKGFTTMPILPGLVLRGIASIENDNTSDALLHITPYVLDGDTKLFPANRHYLGIQGWASGFGEKPLLEIDEKGFIGIGTDDPYAKLHVSDGDIYIADIEKGIIMKSPDGNCWRGVLDNSGDLNFSPVDCPELSLVEVQELKPSQSVKVFPNPSETSVTIYIQNGKTRDYKYAVINMLGEIVMRGKINRNINQIDISNLNAGLYIIEITDRKGTVTASNKIIKQ